MKTINTELTNEEKATEICQNMLLCEHCAKLQFCKSNKHARCFHFIKTEKAILQMAEWKDEQAKRQFIDKAVRWLKDNALHYCYKSAFTGDAMIDINRLAERFEIAMQEK